MYPIYFMRSLLTTGWLLGILLSTARWPTNPDPGEDSLSNKHNNLRFGKTHGTSRFPRTYQGHQSTTLQRSCRRPTSAPPINIGCPNGSLLEPPCPDSRWCQWFALVFSGDALQKVFGLWFHLGLGSWGITSGSPARSWNWYGDSSTVVPFWFSVEPGWVERKSRGNHVVSQIVNFQEPFNQFQEGS
jgi:hypothetical protein